MVYAFLKWSLILVLFSSLCGCQEPASPSAALTAQHYRLTKSIRTSTYNFTTYTYQYNSAGQLANYTIRAGNQEDAPRQTTVFHYDQQGRLTGAERLPASSFLTGRLAYTYDNNGNLTRVALSEDVNQNGQFILTQTITLNYSIDKLPLTSTTTMGNRTEVTHFTYDQGNVVKTDRTVSPGNELPQTILYKHDDKPNPTYGLLIGTPTAETFNKNNIIYEGSERTYTGGLLTALHTNVNESSDVQSFITYEYEAY